MWNLAITLWLLAGGAHEPGPDSRSVDDLVHPDATASLDERIRFYVERLGDTSYVAYRPLEDLYVEWYEAAEQLGTLGAPAVPPLITLLRETIDVFERTQVFYALLLAAQDHRIRLGLAIRIPDQPMAYPEPGAHEMLREEWLRWWEVNGEAVSAIEGTNGSGWGGTKSPYMVSQPIDVGDAGVVPGENTYVRWGDDPGMAVLLTVDECQVSTPDGFANRNAASLMGISLHRVERTERPTDAPPPWPGLFGDTLRVTMDLSRFTVSAEPAVTAWRQHVVDVTTRCMIENARREPRAAFLEIVVEGPPEFGGFARVYPLRD